MGNLLTDPIKWQNTVQRTYSGIVKFCKQNPSEGLAKPVATSLLLFQEFHLEGIKKQKWL